MTDGGNSTIRFTRPSRYADMLRSYRILIDGEDVGHLAEGEVLDVRVAAGSHSIEARVDWGRSEPLVVEAVQGQATEVEVSNRWGVWLSLWAITFGMNTYLKLTPKVSDG